MNIELSTLVQASKLFIPVIAIAGVYIAWQQFTANREKLRHDLFDRRFKVYDVIVSSMQDYLYGEEEVGREQYRRFKQACNEAQFLLPIKVYKTVNTTEEVFTKLHRLKLKILRRSKKEGKEAEVSELTSQVVKLEEDLENMSLKVTESFGLVLKFEKF